MAVVAAGLLGVAALAASCSSGPSTESASRTTTSVKSSPTTSPTPRPNVPDDTTAGPLGPLQGGSVAVAAPTGTTVSPPATIASDCGHDVTGRLKRFLNKLPSGSTVLNSPQACYQVDKGIKLRNKQDLTIFGGTFTNAATTPGKKKHSKGQPVFTVVGGSNISFKSLKINGSNPGGYHPNMVFASAIDVEGTKGITIEGVTISNVFGDGITLAPLPGGADHASGTILNATSNAVITGVTVSGNGRQAVALASVSGAQIGNLVVENPGLNTFDVEADQLNEGADNVTVDGCTSSGGGVFFANGGAGAGENTHDLTIAHCAMAGPTTGDAILIDNPKNSKHQRGPIDLVADVFYCGASDSVACVQLSGANATVEDSVLHFPVGTVNDDVYHVVEGSNAVFTNDSISGYGRTGHVSKDSTLEVNGGHWVSATGASGPA